VRSVDMRGQMHGSRDDCVASDRTTGQDETTRSAKVKIHDASWSVAAEKDACERVGENENPGVWIMRHKEGWNEKCRE